MTHLSPTLLRMLLATPLKFAGDLSFPGCALSALKESSPRLLRRLMLCIVISLAVVTTMVDAASNESTENAFEQRIKAASLYKFLGYAEWPPAAFAGPDSPYVIGIVAAEEIAQELSRISANREVNGRKLVIRRLKRGDALAGIHVLFIGRSARDRQAQWLQLAQRLPILTVTETLGALAQGSMINFLLVEDRVRFEVSLDALEESNIKLSSRMLSIALHAIKGARR
jgi:hypothetical protein